MIQSTTNPFFAILIRKHRFLGRVFSAYLLEMNAEKHALTTVGRIVPDTFSRYEYTFSEAEKLIVKRIDDYSDEQLFLLLKKRVRSLPEFFKLIETSQEVREYLREYIERMMLMIFDLAAANQIPVYMKDDNYETISADECLEAVPEAAEPVFCYELTGNELKYALSAVDGKEQTPFHFKGADLLCMDPCLVRVGKRLYRFVSIDGKKINPFITKPFITIPESSVGRYMETFVQNSIYSHQVHAKGFDIKDKPMDKHIILSLEESLLGDWALYLRFQYGSKEYLYGSKSKAAVLLEVENGRYCFYRFERDAVWEREQEEGLREIGLVKRGIDSGFVPDVEAPPTIYNLIRWLSEHTDVLKERNIVVKQYENKTPYYLAHSEIEVVGEQKEDWFDIQGNVKLDGYEFPFLKLKQNILEGIREFMLPDKRIFLIPDEWFTAYKTLFMLGKTSGNKLRLSRLLFNVLAETPVKAPTAGELRRRFASSALGELTIPTGLKATLRNYQKEGLFWLKLLDQNRMGGCLADDMGLGKTLQVLAFLQLQKEERDAGGNTTEGTETSRTTLIVVPASLVHNWLREIERFTTDMTVCVFTGVQRTRDLTELMRYDLIISTYGTVRNDIDLLKETVFDYVILDESQVIKNPESKSYLSILLLKARGFLSLSGTPIENSLMDLWAQMNVLNRGMLGSRNSFRKEFVIPIEKGDDPAKRDLLKKLIEPFLLRRKKTAVAKDLPEITKQIVYCEMTEIQADVYENEKNAIRMAILENISEQGFERSTISILKGLTRLRQLANHPAMIYKQPEFDSGKFEEITRNLESITEEGHKVLVFSSFVKHLNLVAGYLDKKNIGYAMLTGSTTKREEEVDRFQKEENVPVFLISIKAGGVGLNLTAADYVFIIDPWWNPAAEEQAISRAHRIGQDKKIFVYRFISVDTVEEKIIRLQERKELLARDFTDSANPLRLLGEEHVMDLLS